MLLKDIMAFAIYILGIFILAMTFKRYVNRNNPSDQEDWRKQLEEEHQLQFVRSKPLDPTLMLSIDFTRFPVSHDQACQKAYLSLMHFEKLPLANLKGVSNLEIKKKYGASGVDKISQYEWNYTSCMQAAIHYAEVLIENGYITEAQNTLECCIEAKCDLSKCYLLLIDLYKMQQNESALIRLKDFVNKELKDSPFIDKIIRHFNDDLKESV